MIERRIDYAEVTADLALMIALFAATDWRWHGVLAALIGWNAIQYLFIPFVKGVFAR